MNKDQKGSLRAAGFQPSSSDSNKWVNPTNNHWAKSHDGGSVTISTSRHNTYGADMSKTNFDGRLKK